MTVRRIILLLLFITVPANGSITDCHIIYNRCIFIDLLNQIVDQPTAQENCLNYGGQLVVISSADKNEFILNTISQYFHKTQFWIGLKQNYISWYNSEGTTLKKKDFINWEPNIFRRNYFTENHCAVIDAKSGLWKITNCRYTNYAICEINITECRLFDIQISNGQLDKCRDSTQIKVGTRISVTCDQGFILHGFDFIDCTLAGWSEIPRCDSGCLLPDLTVSRAKIFNPKPEYAVGEKLLIYCDDGYLIHNKNNVKTHEIVECNSDGTWPFLNTQCVYGDNLKCDGEICTEIKLVVKEYDDVILECPLNDGSHNYSYFRWFRNHNIVNSVHSDLILINFSSESIGTYTCFRGNNSTNIEYVLIYYVEVEKSCPEMMIRNLPTITANEGESIYLQSSDLTSKVVWFKDGEVLTFTKDVNILLNGDVLIKNITLEDQGLYKYEVKNENTSCTDIVLLGVYVNPKAESVCGQTDDENDQPWVVALYSQDETSPFCYGTLINEYWIISSAFCISKYSKRKFGGVNAQFRDATNSTWIIPVKKFVVHPRYSRRLSINDIGLAKLTVPVTFSNIFKPLCFSARDFFEEENYFCDVNSQIGLVAGWGSIETLMSSEFGPVRIENLTSVSEDVCQQFVTFEFPCKMFCATHENPYKNTGLVGDLGSPFLVRDGKVGGRYYLQGIFSWGERVPRVGNYDYFTKVPTYYDWIKFHLEH